MIALTVGAATSGAQSPKDPAFDVAAIKPAADTQVFSFSRVQPGGRYIGQNMSLRLLIKTAYGVHDSQIAGGTVVDRQRSLGHQREGRRVQRPHDIPRYVSPDGAAAARGSFQARHASRTARASGLRARPHEGERRVRSAVPAQRRPRLRQAHAAASDRGGRRRTSFRSGRGGDGFNPRHLGESHDAQLHADRSSARTAIDRVVVDHTGLTGKFDWEVQWVPEDLRVDGAARPEGPSIFDAFRQQLGLKLEPARDRVDVLVIDHVERPQTD